MILGIGVDVIEIERIKEALNRHGHRLVDRLFTVEEQSKSALVDEAAYYAILFAAKEALAKALGTGIARKIDWKEIEVDFTGRAVSIKLGGRAHKRRWKRSLPRYSLLSQSFALFGAGSRSS